MKNKVIWRCVLLLALIVVAAFSVMFNSGPDESFWVFLVFRFFGPICAFVVLVSICFVSFDGNGGWINAWELKPGKPYVVTAVDITGEVSETASRNTATSYAVLRPRFVTDKNKDEVLLVRFEKCHLKVGQQVAGVTDKWLSLHRLVDGDSPVKLVLVGGSPEA